MTKRASDKPLRIDRGIYKTVYGFRVVISIGGKLETKRFPPSYALPALQRWRDEHVRLHRPEKTQRGTLAFDVDRYLHAVAAMPTFSDRKRQIEAWLPRFAKRPRWTLRPDELRTQLAEWRVNLAPNTCNHRRSALSHLYTVLDGKAAYNPLRDVPPYKLPPPLKRGLPLTTILTALRRVKGKQTRARLLVLLWTGMRPSELMRVQASDLNLDRGRCYVRTAKGGPAREIALNRSAVKAFKVFARREAWGSFSVQSIRKSLVLACRKEPKLPIFRVYDLRHSFALALRESGADLSDIQYHLGHTDISLTKRYAPAVLPKLEKAAADTRNMGRKLPAALTSQQRNSRK